ncbi:MAG: hypothetical protein AAF805_04670 [Planctomycetota bacterium]
MNRPARSLALALSALAAATLATPVAEAGGFRFGPISVGGGAPTSSGGGSFVKVGPVRVGNGGIRVGTPKTGPIRIAPPVFKPPVLLPKPPVVLPKPPIVIGPPKVCPKPIHPPVHPPIHPPIHPPVIAPKPPVCPPPVCPPPIVTPPIVTPTPCPPVHPTPIPTPIPAPTVPQPIVPQPIGPAPTTTAQLPWYFGMSLARSQTAYGTGLRVAIVTHGAPAHLAGLKAGDTLLVAGAVPLQSAATNQHGVQLVQSAVTATAAPAPTMTLVSTGSPTLPIPPAAHVTLTILDGATGQLRYVTVQPRSTGVVAAAPAPTATM